MVYATFSNVKTKRLELGSYSIHVPPLPRGQTAPDIWLMGIGRKQVWVHIPYASCCFGEWHPWLQEVDCCDPKILTDTCYRVLDLGLWWSSWRELALSGFSQVNKTPPGVLLELTVMSRGSRLMRAFFPAMDDGISLYTKEVSFLCIGWNCRIFSVPPELPTW